MLRLMNSAMMPEEGIYVCHRITKNEFKEIFHSHKEWVSYIGYPQTADILSEMLGVNIPVSRAETILEDGDVLLVAKLNYRVSSPLAKGQYVSEKDFSFLKIDYKKE